MITHVGVASKKGEPGRVRGLRFFFESGNECLFDWPSGEYVWLKPPTPEERAEAEKTVKQVPIVP